MSLFYGSLILFLMFSGVVSRNGLPMKDSEDPEGHLTISSHSRQQWTTKQDGNEELGFILCFFFQNCDKNVNKEIQSCKQHKKRCSKTKLNNKSKKKLKNIKRKNNFPKKPLLAKTIQMLFIPKFYINVNIDSRKDAVQNRQLREFSSILQNGFNYFMMPYPGSLKKKKKRKRKPIEINILHRISYVGTGETSKVQTFSKPIKQRGHKPSIKTSQPTIETTVDNVSKPVETLIKEFSDETRPTAVLENQDFNSVLTTKHKNNDSNNNKIETIENRVIFLMKALERFSKTHKNLGNVTDECSKWGSTIEKIVQDHSSIDKLPSCPCVYPFEIAYGDKIHDPYHNDFFSWQPISDEIHTRVFFKHANACIKSTGLEHLTLSSQVCCYDSTHYLITRGRGAGFPLVFTPEISRKLHILLDLHPWKLCQGNFKRFHAIRNTNNGQNCSLRPEEDQFNLELEEAFDY